jgi:hypothetical protein
MKWYKFGDSACDQCFIRFPPPKKNCLLQLSSVGMATGYELDGQLVGVWVAVEARFFSSSSQPARYWGPPSLLSIRYRRQSGRGSKLTTHIKLMRGCTLHSPIRVHGAVLNYLSRDTNLPLPAYSSKQECHRNVGNLICVLKESFIYGSLFHFESN